MGLFKSRDEKELDAILERIKMAMSNNYKDAAQSDFQTYLQALEKVKMRGSLKEKKLKGYEDAAEFYKSRLKGYTHKDQKPFWTKQK